MVLLPAMQVMKGAMFDRFVICLTPFDFYSFVADERQLLQSMSQCS
jgi:hypothetical protein